MLTAICRQVFIIAPGKNSWLDLELRSIVYIKVAATIKNERQYRITKAQVQRFEQALAELAKYPEDKKQENLLLWQAQMSALASQCEDMKAEIAEYEALTTRPADEPLVFSLDSIEALPLALIKARIAAKLSQKELAERLGLKEQQIQRYEATEYASANMARVIEVSQALGVKLQ